MAHDSKPPAGGSRFLKLAGRTAAVAGGYAKDRVKRTFRSDEQHEELDCCNESDNVRAFRAHDAGDRTVIIPAVLGHRSVKRVLTLHADPNPATLRKIRARVPVGRILRARIPETANWFPAA